MALFPGRLMSKNRDVTSTSVVGGSRSNTAFRALIEMGIVMFLHFKADDNAAKVSEITNDLSAIFSVRPPTAATVFFDVTSVAAS